MNCGFTLFDTAVGTCGIAWSEHGVTCLQLPEADRARTHERLLSMVPGGLESTPPPHVCGVITAVVRHLRGEPGDLASVDLDMSRVPPFRRRVYDTARAIPAGETLTYAAVAERMGKPGAARAVGQALARNPFALIVPCHRVVAAGGKPGGFSAGGGVTTKLGLLAIERAGAQRPAGTGGPAGAYPFDPVTAVAYLRASDPALADLIDSTGPFAMPLNEAASVFGALAEAVVYQQLSNKAAATIHRRVRALFPDSSEGLLPEQILGASDEQLRSAGLSRPKLASLRDLAHKVDAGVLPELEAIRGMDDEAVIQCLSSVRGIGRWTAQMFLMFRLGRPDVLPVDDYGIRNGFSIAFGKAALAGREEIETRGARWRPFRTVACWYLWEAVERTKRGSSA
ncbi:methylated-DNA--[protein]-cysteine S-methyltransferase [Streptomyces sp. AC512_CC834]|uniref:methylated-DNA--[protein]-cysteine S-methyltransferase n=1 Tax=Streptomyces sp. AC512_CC834 TaxID=2823691 RepID=UPI001C26CD8D|nr:methylated-DNA--[protein]-cysteine S-methyltransferase [Streptomyces sp. AC512_CC834]